MSISKAKGLICMLLVYVDSVRTQNSRLPLVNQSMDATLETKPPYCNSRAEL